MSFAVNEAEIETITKKRRRIGQKGIRESEKAYPNIYEGEQEQEEQQQQLAPIS